MPTVGSSPGFDVVHLALTRFPSDTRVRREALASAVVGRAVAVVASRHPGEAAEETLDNLTVIRLPVTKQRGGPFRYIWQYVAFTFQCRSLLKRDPRFANTRVVHVHTLPDFLIAAAVHRRSRGTHLILDLHEVFPEFARSKYPGLLGYALAPLARSIERWSRKAADLTITVNAPIERLLASRPAKRSERIVIIHNSADPTDFGPLCTPRPTGQDGGCRLVYHGTLTSLYGLDTAIRGVAHAAANGLDPHFTIVGDGPDKPALQSLVDELGVRSRVAFVEPLPQAALPALLRNFDAGLVPTRLDLMTRFSLSNKLFEYLHLGIPVLATRLPSYEEYLSDSSLWYWEPGDPSSLADTIARFARASSTERTNRIQDAQRRMHQFSWERERETLKAIYEEFLATA